LNFGETDPAKIKELIDPDGDGIYEATILFRHEALPADDGIALKRWQLKSDISKYPAFTSPNTMLSALYNMSLDELNADIRQDGAFMAGAKWPGVWTRDISYSIILSLAAINPDASKASLMAKVKDGKIIQDTGTGGSWPVSSDRMVWAMAAWEIYCVTGDKEWLKQSFEIIKKSAADDITTLCDNSTGLFRGESSFLDWREQTYPRWMEPKDIFCSLNLGTNVVHCMTYSILNMMAAEQQLGSDVSKISIAIKEAINNNLWLENKGYFGQYLYGRNHYSLSPRSEALGEALAVLYNVADKNRQKSVIENTPVTEFGIPCIYPQIPNIPPYHNDAVWPFVESFWAWASAKTGNEKSVSNAISNIYRASAFFLSNKENYVATTGDYAATQINSDRQLWSVAGNLSTFYRVIFGMQFTPSSLRFFPLIPKSYKNKYDLENFKYRNSLLDITITGFGNTIKSFSIDGRNVKTAEISANLTGKHKVLITLGGMRTESSKINIVSNSYSPETPEVKTENNLLVWNKIPDAKKYAVYKNGKKTAEVKGEKFYLPADSLYAEYQIASIDAKQHASFLSEPVDIHRNEEIYQPEKDVIWQNDIKGYTGDGFVITSYKEKRSIRVNKEIETDGLYSVEYRYSNGSGPVNTDNKCAIRSLYIDEKYADVVVMPQRGDGLWTNWGYSNPVFVNLSKGTHEFRLVFGPSNNNMNVDTNTALIDNIRFTRIK
jgi:hypothetical protein